MADLRTWLETIAEERSISRGARRVIEVISADPELASYASAHTLAAHAEVNVATVVRAVQSLGYEGWVDFSQELRSRYLSSLAMDTAYERVSAGDGDPVTQIIGQDLRLLESLLAQLDPHSVREAAGIIESSRQSAIFTTGTYSAPAQQLAHVGQMLGYDITTWSGSGTEMLNRVQLLGEGDCFITFGIWQQTILIRELALLARQRGVKIITVGDRHSEVAEASHVFINVPSESRNFVPSLIPLTSVVQAILRTLADSDREGARRRLGALSHLWGELGIVDDM